jgi:hypothetical protein
LWSAARLGDLECPDPSPVEEVLDQGFARTGTRYHGKHMQISLIVLFALRVKEQGAGVLDNPFLSA